MKYLLASTLLAVIAAASTAAIAQTSGSTDTPRQCTMGYVTGVGGAALSFREYLATADRDKYRYVADNPINCKISDDGRATDCMGVANFRHEKVSVYDDIDSTTMSVVARVELDHGMTYPAIILVRKQDVQCGE